MGSEVWQFLIVLSGFFVIAALWLLIVYLPGRTLERWEVQRPGRGEAKTAAPVGPVNSEESPEPGP